MITILKAKENNLQSINVNIPFNRVVVVTGVSGSGKSTLVYDVIYKEARRRYLESFSANARQFMDKLSAPDVQYISGLSPAIALEQRNIVKSPHSTVGTLSETYDLLRLLFARVGKSDKDIKINRNLFSFNAKEGACTDCKGIGVLDEIDPELLVSKPHLTIREGAFEMTTPSGYIVYSQVTMDVLDSVCQAEGFNVDTPWNELSDENKKIVLYGSNAIKVPFGKHTLESRMKWSGIVAKPREEGYYKGIVPVMDEILKRDRNPNILRFTKSVMCPSCHGSRLNKQALSVKVKEYNIAQLTGISIDKLVQELNELNFSDNIAAESIKKELLKTLRLVQKLGLGYLTLDRSSSSLSGGETQRLRLAKLTASGLRGILYIFDEPSVGLHPRDAANLMEVLRALRENGNSVIIVDHNSFIMQQADWIIDMGPGAGKKGGHVIFNGLASEFFAAKNIGNSKTLHHIQNPPEFKLSSSSNFGALVVAGAKANNLKEINAEFKLGALNVVCGVSGAGKSTLVNQTIANYFSKKLNNSKEHVGEVKSIIDNDTIKKLFVVDQSTIGKTPRSNPATYTGLSDELRNLFAALPEAKDAGFKKSHFSFNTKGGRCERCEGAGYLQVGMQMLGTIEMLCPTCQGKQFKPEILKVKYKDHSIADIYQMHIEDALPFFKDQTKIERHLRVMVNLGLGYLKLNQRSSTLSGGEGRRIKLAKGLVKPSKQHALYIIDEPSSGLHAHDVQVLLNNLEDLVKKGNTIIVTEHHEQFIKAAHHLVELGPDSGETGGRVVFEGIPADILNIKNSLTAKALRNEYLLESANRINPEKYFAPIKLKGVSTHNLKEVDVEIPVNKLTVLTGLSGSGKSSLAFDTLFAEGRQRYAESFSAYVRNRLNINSEASYDQLDGVMPTIAVNQQHISANSRSTVGTLVGVNEAVRLLFSRVGKAGDTDEKIPAGFFSFNNERGACPHCQGLGYTMSISEDKLIDSPEKSLLAGAMDGTKPGKFYGNPFGQYTSVLRAVGKSHQIDYTKAYNTLDENARKLAMYGTADEEYAVSWEYKRGEREGVHNFQGKWPGFIAYLNEEYLRKSNDKRGDAFNDLLDKETCTACNGRRLNAQALKYKVLDKSISQFMDMEIKDLLLELQSKVVIKDAFSTLAVEQRAAQIICGSVVNGLDILNNLGLGYLSLSRAGQTLSGGELQRVKLAGCIARDLSGVCIVLDEPTSGLHPKDSENLVYMINELKRQGNTVVVCEHDPYFIRMADHIIDLGPGAGNLGGEVVASGNLKSLMQNKRSVTGQYLDSAFSFSRSKRKTTSESIAIKQASANNLKNIDVALPTNQLVVLSGVSGSGKSSLMHEVIYQSFTKAKPIACKSIAGLNQFDLVVHANQYLGKKHGGSYIAQFLGLDKDLARHFAASSKAKEQQLKKSHFTLSNKLGKCPECQGTGFVKTAMDFLSDVQEPCKSCKGLRFNPTALSVSIDDLSMADYLKMSLSQLAEQNRLPKLNAKIELAIKLGLGYLNLGQALSTLSGGEKQRLKLTQSLLENEGKKTLYLLDEPTTGLHMQDVEKLMLAFDELLNKGHSLIVIEHHEQLIRNADCNIVLGPGAGQNGGELVN